MPDIHIDDNAHTRRLRADMAALLREKGALTSAEWERAFKMVPRHTFVPRIFLPSTDNDGTYRPLDGTDPAQRETWLSHVYRDDICITQLDGDDSAWATAVTEGTVRASAMTCTSSQPTLMASMLEELDLHDGDTVLELGTGTGYNAALLCERLGSHSVASVDVDPALVEHARGALDTLGYTPFLAAGDGALGNPEAAPYTHLITTASFPSIPPAWLDQVSVGGTILANLFRPLGGGVLVKLTVDEHGASGHFSRRTAGFMPTRLHETPPALSLYQRVNEADEEAAAPQRTGLDLADTLRSPDARFFLALLGDFDEIRIRYPDHPEEQWIVTADGSWAFSVPADDGGSIVRQGGQRRLFDEFEALVQRWHDLGDPSRERLGLTTTREGAQIWLDRPDQPIADLPMMHSG